MELNTQLNIKTIDFFYILINNCSLNYTYNPIHTMEFYFQVAKKTVDILFILLNLAQETLFSAFNADVLITTFEQIEILGHSLYTYGAILLIILSVILLLAMFAIIIISKSNNNNKNNNNKNNNNNNNKLN
jgi:hypothetical protein